MIRSEYGNLESNPINDEVRAIRDSIVGEVDLDDSNLVRITRLRLVSDPGFPLWDLSYCYGQLRNGDHVRVHLPQHQFSKKFLKREIIAMCREAHVYAKGLGLLDDEVLSKLT
jgi:hypothetical protein